MRSIVFENNTDKKINLDLAKEILKYLEISEIELILTNNDEIQEINATTRGINKPTDVLSFPYEEMPGMPMGSIVISNEFIHNYSIEYKHSYEEEFALLFIHGALHIIGYDHEVDNGEHRQKEEELIKHFNLPNSLIIRNSRRTDEKN
jgi:probable rRNA maturation factor